MKQKLMFGFSFLAASILLTSCLKDEEFKNNEVGTVPSETKAVSLPQARLTAIASGGSLESIAGGQKIKVALAIEGPNPSPVDINFTLVVNNALLANFSAATSFVPIPAGSVTISNARIRAGRMVDSADVTITGANTLNPVNTYAIAILLSSVDNGYSIAGNMKVLPIKFALKNRYDGHYSSKGYKLRAGDPGLTGNVCCLTMDLITAGPNSVDAAALFTWADGTTGIGLGGNNTITINPSTFATTVSCSAFPSVANTPGYNTRYDPNTKTFFMSWTWGAGPTARLSIDTLTYIRPR